MKTAPARRLPGTGTQPETLAGSDNAPSQRVTGNSRRSLLACSVASAC